MAHIGNSREKEIAKAKFKGSGTAEEHENPNFDVVDSELEAIENSVGNSRSSYIFAPQKETN